MNACAQLSLVIMVINIKISTVQGKNWQNLIVLLCAVMINVLMCALVTSHVEIIFLSYYYYIMYMQECSLQPKYKVAHLSELDMTSLAVT